MPPDELADAVGGCSEDDNEDDEDDGGVGTDGGEAERPASRAVEAERDEDEDKDEDEDGRDPVRGLSGDLLMLCGRTFRLVFDNGLLVLVSSSVAQSSWNTQLSSSSR